MSGASKALVVALSFCRLLGLGCPKQAFAKIATPRFQVAFALHGWQRMNDYQTVIQLRFGLKRYFEFYNHGRLHQSLDYQTPNEVYFSLEC
jgi:transposase InsO family protein